SRGEARGRRRDVATAGGRPRGARCPAGARGGTRGKSRDSRPWGRSKPAALHQPASGKVSGVTTGNATLWAARRLEPTVDARETGPGPLSRLPGAYPSGRDGVRELRGLRDGRGGRAAQPSPRPRPRARAEIVRGGLPPSEAIARSRPKSGPREG